MPLRLLSSALLITLTPALVAQQPLVPQAEIHVDQRCRILTQIRAGQGAPYSQSIYRRNDGVCHVESPHESSHWEEDIQNGVVKRTYVTIIEKDFILHNPAPDPVVFVLAENLPKGWIIDSDPQPDEVANSIATFRIHAQPGQTVRLHVGQKR